MKQKPVQIIAGCVLSVLPTLDEGSVHCCVTSPPYMGLRDYGIEPSNWPAISYAPMAGLPAVEVEAWTGCLGQEPSIEMYVGHLVTVFRLVWRVLRDDGTLWLNLGDSFADNGISHLDVQGATSTSGKANTRSHQRKKVPIGLKKKDLMMIPARVALALQADGWYLRSEIIWAKGLSFCATYAGSVMPESVTDRVTRSHEQVFMLTKKARYFYDAEAVKEKSVYSTWPNVGAKSHEARREVISGGDAQGATETASTRNLRSVWVINPEASSRSHYAGFPSALVAPMIKAGTSEKGVCPACLAPWVRVVDYKANYDRREPAHAPNSTPTKVDSTGWRPPDIKTTGWCPACSCDAGPAIPATVLDIFAGTAMTAKVASRLGRRSIMIERSPDYVKMGHERNEQHELFMSPEET